MIAFRVPTGADELTEARFFGYPLHESSMRPVDGDCRPGCRGCIERRWDHDPGDEHDAAERIAASGEALDRIVGTMLNMSRLVESDAELRARALRQLSAR